MKITSHTSLPVELNAETQSTQRARAAKSSAAGKADEVSISQAAKDLGTVDLARQEKIAALKRSIESGTYRVEPDKIANSILAEITASNKNVEKL